MKKISNEQRQARAKYQAQYRKEHPEYVARCRELEKPKLERYRRATEAKRKDKIIRDYLRQGMIIGWYQKK